MQPQDQTTTRHGDYKTRQPQDNLKTTTRHDNHRQNKRIEDKAIT